MCITSRERYFRPRPEWVWDREANPDLDAMALLKAHIRGPEPDELMEILRQWLAGHAAKPLSETLFVTGGAAVEIETHPPGQMDVLFTSGGQDALESLEDVVLGFHAAVLLRHPQISVWWEELPLVRD